MIYYRPKYNDIYLNKMYKKNNRTYYHTKFIAKRELLTSKEIKKLKKDYYNFNIEYFEKIKINKNRTYIFFGIRTISEDEKIENIKD